jgi:Glycosyltransferase Family 4
MRILEIAPAGVPVREDSTDPVAATVHELVEGLVDRGHDVTLWADPRSQTRARLLSNRRIPENGSEGRAVFERLYAFAATSVSDEFDVVHNHAGAAVAGMLWRFAAPALSTVYGTAPDEGRRGRVIAASWSLRGGLAEPANCAGVIYPGVPVDDLPFGDGDGGYLLYAAPVSPEYGARTAALTARRLELPLRIAGAVPTAYRQYFEQQLRPLLQPGTVDYLGPLSR